MEHAEKPSHRSEEAVVATDEGDGKDAERVTVVGIGASAGGVQALRTFLQAVPRQTGIAFVIVVHLAADRKSHLADVLQSAASIPVQEVTERTRMQPDHAYLIPPGKHIEITDGHLTLSELEEPRWRRAPIDHFFRTLAYAHPDGTGVILSGGGADGTVGMKSIKEQGGILMVQDPDEAEHDAMPNSAISTGLVDFVLPVEKLVHKILELHRNTTPYLLPERPDELPEPEAETLGKILSELHAEVQHDFSGYKRPTLLRRIQRRMRVTQNDTLQGYLEFLQANPQEAEALFKDLLISVTTFFRDPDSWEVLAETVIPELFEGKTKADEVRVWVPGCATGEEAYSIAILLLEHAQTLEEAPYIQIFASDLDENALSHAREGIYPESITADVSEERITRFFNKHENSYQVTREVRDLTLFAVQDVLRDPPFSKIDLVSCRNLLIYLQRDLQEKVLRLLHYALRPTGYLFLGKSETVHPVPSLFHSVRKKAHIYQQRPQTGRTRKVPDLPLTLRPRARAFQSRQPRTTGNALPGGEELHRRSLEEQAPPSVLVADDHEILHLSSTAGRYLAYSGGSPSHNILKAIRNELTLDLSNALHRAFQENKATSAGPIELEIDGEQRLVHLIVRPVQEGPAERCALVVFAEVEPSEPSSARGDRSDSDPRLGMFTQEVKRLRGQLQKTIEDHETSEEDLKAANEELQSINEEYKSTLEELETSKEELQSVNEELHTVNEELQAKVAALERANDDLKNLMTSTEVATVFLNRELKIKRFTPQIRTLFNIRTSDHGRPIADLSHHLAGYDNLVADAEHVLEELEPVEHEVQTTNEEWFLVRFLPYRTVDDRIKGVVITFVNISRLKHAEEEIRQLATQLLIAEENERDRVAEMLHDELQQQLVGLQMRVRKLMRKAASMDPAALEKALEQIDDFLQQAVDETRNLTVDLSPPVLSQNNLAETIDWLVKHMHELHDLQVDVQIDKNVDITQREINVLLFKTIRELLFNVVKHADVKQARVDVRTDQDTLRLRVTDEGKGFDVADVLQGKERKISFGLPSVRERVRFLGGRINVDSKPGEGTEVTVNVPVNSHHKGSGEQGET